MKIIIDATFNPHGGTLTHLQEFLKFMSMSTIRKFNCSNKKENIDVIGASILTNAMSNSL